jgi:glycosyltransferase involved in cell wall biosynthesis
VSHHIRQVMITAGVPVKKLEVVHSGVRSRAGGKNILDFPRPIWGAVGALVPHKGHATLVRALAQLPGTGVIVGSGPGEAELRALAANVGVSDRMQFLGQREDMEDLLASFDVLVHPSLEEGLGQVLAEALEAGCRVVASRTGGIPEVVGEGGVLVAPGDASALAAGMRRALGLPWGHGIVQGRRFSVEAMVRGTEAIYAEVLDLRAVKGL